MLEAELLFLKVHVEIDVGEWWLDTEVNRICGPVLILTLKTSGSAKILQED